MTAMPLVLLAGVVYFLFSAGAWFFSSAPVCIRANEYFSHYLLPTP